MRLIFTCSSSNGQGNIKRFMKHFILTVLIGTFLSLGSFAQNGKIKGVITDKSDNSFVRGATVTLLLQKDSSLVKSTFDLLILAPAVMIQSSLILISACAKIL